jgi:capsular polysaccharide biosynthesis protein
MNSVADTDCSILDVAKATHRVEESGLFLNLSRMNFGRTVTEEGTRGAFGILRHTTEIRSFLLRDTIFHGPLAMLFSRLHKVRETRYLVPETDYRAAHVTDVVPITGDAPVVIGFNKAWWGYYHWVVQCLPAIDMAMRWNNLAGARLLLPKLTGWHTDLLDLLGYRDVERIEVDRAFCYAMPNAIYSEYLNGKAWVGISCSALQTFQRLRKFAPRPVSQHEAIYVARTDTNRRRMRNEEALIRFLEGEGVRIVVPGALSVAEQIGLFSGAKIVIGPHGGGLTNVVFCPDDAIVYELHPSHYLNVCFNRLAQARGLDYWMDLFPSDGEGAAHDRGWTVDLEYTKRRFAELRETAGMPLRSGAGEQQAHSERVVGRVLPWLRRRMSRR